MTPPLGDFDLSEPEPAPRPAVEPKVFVRTLTTPPGLPWEQTRAADLEARHGAPIPIQDVALQLRRLETWRPGRAGRFAALYVPSRAISDRFETTVTIDGVPTEVVFLSPRAKAAERRRLVIIGGVCAVGVALLVSSLGTVMSRREAANARLENAETLAASRVRAAAAQRRQREEARAMQAAPDRGAPLSAVLTDLAWVSAVKASEARVEAFHWERGAVALEVRGTEAPIPEQGAKTVERAKKPIRRGVWLWIITPPERNSGVDRPVVAEPLIEARPR